MALIQWVIKQSSIEKKKNKADQPGLDLTRAIGDALVLLGLASRDTSCCTYNLDAGYTSFTPTTGSTIIAKSNPVDNFIDGSGTLAALTIKLPVTPFDGQRVLLTFRQAVTTLTIDGNGTTLLGTAPTSASVGTRLMYKFYKGDGWLRLN